jgi:hypothetical protein
VKWFGRASSAPSRDLAAEVEELRATVRRLDLDLDDLTARFKRWTGRETKARALDATNGHDHEAPADGASADALRRDRAARLTRGQLPTLGALRAQGKIPWT